MYRWTSALRCEADVRCTSGGMCHLETFRAHKCTTISQGYLRCMKRPERPRSGFEAYRKGSSKRHRFDYTAWWHAASVPPDNRRMIGISARQLRLPSDTGGETGSPAGAQRGSAPRRAIVARRDGDQNAGSRRATSAYRGGRAPEERGRRSSLDGAAEIHNGDLVADMTHDPQVVGDEQVGEPAFRLNVFQQIDHLGLDRNVERGDRLICDDQRGSSAGLGRSQAADADHRKTGTDGCGTGPDAARRAERDRRPGLGARSGKGAMNPQGFGDDVARPHARVERTVGVLEDHLHAAADLPEVALRRMGDVDPVESNRPGIGLDQPDDHPRQCRFPATALADDPDRFAARTRTDASSTA